MNSLEIGRVSENPKPAMTLSQLRDQIDQEIRQIVGNWDSKNMSRIDPNHIRRTREVLYSTSFIEAHPELKEMDLEEAASNRVVKTEASRSQLLESAVVTGALDPKLYSGQLRSQTETEKVHLEQVAISNALTRRADLRKKYGLLLLNSRARMHNMEARDRIVRQHLEAGIISSSDLRELTDDLENLYLIADCIEAGLFTADEVNKQYLFYRSINYYFDAVPAYKQMIPGIRLAQDGLRWGFINTREEYLDLLRQAAQTE